MRLKDYIEGKGEKPYRWARMNGIPKDQVYRHLKGMPIEYENAKRISEATAGEVNIAEIME